jgi:ADP-ribose pyrophosphatase YjhB (NUDIX family)/O-acetyl-ADP-ribose deacetylase (regulator of RNase III)
MKIKNTTINIIQDDIARLAYDVIVNPANVQLTMEAGLAGALKKSGGETIEREAVLKAPLAPGHAVATKAGQLKAKHIVHAVTVDEQAKTSEAILRTAVANALRCADGLSAGSLVFPAMGCGGGASGFPSVGAAKIMTQEIMKFLRRPTSLNEIAFCLSDDATFDVFNKTIRGYIQHIQETLGAGPYVCVDMIIELPQGIVLIERSNPPYGWALPGGFVDYGESLEAAARREAKEETNLELEGLRQFHTYSDPGRDPRFHTISTVFIARGKGRPQSGDDAKGLKIAAYNDLLNGTYAFDHKEIIREYLSHKK